MIRSRISETNRKEAEDRTPSTSVLQATMGAPQFGPFASKQRAYKANVTSKGLHKEYELGKKIGSGSFATVREAVHKVLCFAFERCPTPRNADTVVMPESMPTTVLGQTSSREDH